ncbi:MAG: fibrobacter succinogenes major paralogous domain-containing protein [Burkholderiales bacterium]|nr:fibrobacter succinogenes major paralogous domain-containing protein [Flavobacterium sp.]
MYGKLYNWYAVNDPRGLAPIGYHVPSDAEWTTLTTFLGGEEVAGGKMKESGTTHWNGPNTNAANTSGFTGLPGVARYDFGTFANIVLLGYWWSSTEVGTPSA